MSRLNRNEWIGCILILLFSSLLPYFIESSRSQNWREPSQINAPYDFKEKYQQFNEDSVIWLNLAAYFPQFYEINNGRINRPTYPAIVNLPARVINGIATFYKYGWGSFNRQIPKNITLVVGQFVNTSIYILFLIFSKSFLEKWIQSSKEKEIAMAMVIASPILPFFIPQIAPNLFGCLISTVCLWCMVTFGDHHRTKVEIVMMSLCMGLLMMGKAHYDMIAIVLVYWAYRRQWTLIGLFSIIHLLPLFFWIKAVGWLGYRYYNTEAEDLEQVVWVFKYFIPMEFDSQYQILSSYLKSFFWNGTRGLGLLFIPCIIFSIWKLRTGFNIQRSLFLLGFIISIVFLFFVKRPHAYMIAMLALLMVPIAAELIVKIKSQWGIRIALGGLLFINAFIYWPSYFCLIQGRQDGLETKSFYNKWLPSYGFQPELIYQKMKEPK